MKKLLPFVIAMSFGLSGYAQSAIGHSTMTFTDAMRNDRQILCEIYYPGVSDGDEVAAADGVFPQVIFGHGFLMTYEAYENIWQYLVPFGYVMIFPTTEGGIIPDHAEFGLDLAYVASHFFDDEANNSSGLFYNRLMDTYAIMGHSMGGGATWLAASGNDGPVCIAGLAPAETNPSAIAASGAVICPALVLSGSSDAVTPPQDHHIPIYDGSGSECKVFVDIIDGSHCGYANSGTLCDIGELGFSGMPRETQQPITHDLLKAWFDYHLMGISSAWSDLQLTDENTQGNTTTTIDCSVDVSETNLQDQFVLFPVPADDFVYLRKASIHQSDMLTIEIYDAMGRQVRAFVKSAHELKSGVSIDLTALDQGVYTLRAYSIGMNDQWSTKLLIQGK
jgi:dienelactone hydrolase